MKKLTILLCVLSLAYQSNAQTKQNPETPSPIIFIYDASGSMWGQMQGKTKMEIASSVLASSLDELPSNQKMGLVAYGHRKKGDCKDVEFLVDVSNGTSASVTAALKGIKPLGMTPLAYSATMVLDGLRNSKEKATIILITDGIESCNGNICDVVSAAKAEGIDFKLHIIGFGLKQGETEQLECAAKAGDGMYYDAADAGGLGDVLNEAVVETVDKPTGNFGVFATKNGEPIDAYVKAYATGTQNEAGTLRTYKETRYMYLPTGTYDLVVTPLSSDVKSITVKNVKNVEGELTVENVSFDGGKFKVSAFNNTEGWDAMVKVLNEDGKVVASTRTYGVEKELEVNPGTYTLSFQALVMEGLDTKYNTKEFTIKAAEELEVSHTFNTGFANIYPKSGGAFIDCVVTVVEKHSGTNVAGSRSYTRGCEFMLNPGSYTIKVVPLGEHKAKASQLFNVEVTTGGTVTKTLNF
jgi:Ca-activated chloride channel family protein